MKAILNGSVGYLEKVHGAENCATRRFAFLGGQNGFAELHSSTPWLQIGFKYKE